MSHRSYENGEPTSRFSKKVFEDIGSSARRLSRRANGNGGNSSIPFDEPLPSRASKNHTSSHHNYHSSHSHQPPPSPFSSSRVRGSSPSPNRAPTPTTNHHPHSSNYHSQNQNPPPPPPPPAYNNETNHNVNPSSTESAVGGSPPSFNPESNQKLAKMLRECSKIVERGDFDPILYQTLGALHVYTGDRMGEDSNISSANANSTGGNVPKTKEKLSTAGKETFNQIAGLGKKLWNSSGISEHIRRYDNSDFANQHAASEEWCDEHFVAGCQCKKMQDKQNQQPQQQHSQSNNQEHDLRPEEEDGNHHNDAQAKSQNFSVKPSFQRPINPNSNLIANGWISQQRRSKMRIVWKDILASLVEGRKPGEETTLWIQRQVTSSTGKAELEALHQIPMKWLEDVTYVDIYGDFRFTIKVSNAPEEFQFRCADSESAQNWVMTLRSARDIAKGLSPSSLPNPTQMNPNQSQPQPQPQHQLQQPQPQPPMQHPINGGIPSPPNSRSHSPTQSGLASSEPPKISLPVKELKAILHGAGISKLFFL